MKRGASILCGLFVCLLSLPAAATIIQVPGDQPTIQAAINEAADGDQVSVSDGIYAGDGNRDIDFLGKAITVRSENGPEKCIIDCKEQGCGFIFSRGEGRDSVLQGFTILNGKTHFDGGIHIEGASPTIAGNAIRNCGDGFVSCSGIYCAGGSPMIINNTVQGNWSFNGGGIHISDGNPTIQNNTISGNTASLYMGGGRGGGIYSASDSAPRIEDCAITGNLCSSYGGGICFTGTLLVNGCTIKGNKVRNSTGTGSGGGVAGIGLVGGEGNLAISNCLLDGNSAQNRGGGIYNSIGSTVVNCIICNNTAYDGGGILNTGCLTVSSCTICDNASPGSGGITDWSYYPNTISSTILWNSGPAEIEAGAHLRVSYSDVRGGWPGVGNIDSDPLFKAGSFGHYYLSHIACGDMVTSPCVGAGDPSPAVCGTTGCLAAWGSADMGYHYPAAGLVVGPGPGVDDPPAVQIFPPRQDAEAAFEFDAYDTRQYGVNVACGDVHTCGLDHILTGPGPGITLGPHVRGFRVDGRPLAGLSYLAYDILKWGVNVAAGDLDGDGRDEVITGAGPGPACGPHVRGWNYDGGPEVTPLFGVNFFAYGARKWGVNVACGDIDGDGYDEIITGPGPGFIYGPHVRGWNVDDGPATAMPAVSFLSYGTQIFGVNVTSGDLDGDGIDEIVTGPGPCGLLAAHVRGWKYDGSAIEPLAGFSFFAWDSSRCGANVHAGADLDGDGRDDLVVGCGSGPAAGNPVKVFSYDRSEIALRFSLGDGSGMTSGANVAAGRF